MGKKSCQNLFALETRIMAFQKIGKIVGGVGLGEDTLNLCL
jgi:hypothetical protein